MTLKDIYNQNFTLLGSPRMVAFFESLEDIPYEDRKVSPHLSTISITSDGFMIINGDFYGSVKDLEDNLYGLCEHFNIDDSEVSRLMRNTVDWRKGGNAYSY
jgi:hypothetical protein